LRLSKRHKPQFPGSPMLATTLLTFTMLPPSRRRLAAAWDESSMPRTLRSKIFWKTADVICPTGDGRNAGIVDHGVKLAAECLIHAAVEILDVDWAADVGLNSDCAAARIVNELDYLLGTDFVGYIVDDQARLRRRIASRSLHRCLLRRR